jgi:hypothetical protein
MTWLVNIEFVVKGLYIPNDIRILACFGVFVPKKDTTYCQMAERVTQLLFSSTPWCSQQLQWQKVSVQQYGSGAS